MGADGGGVQRISFGEGRYATPVWSPRGDLSPSPRSAAAASHRRDAAGRLAASAADQGFLDEGPTWAPNGRVLMFFRQQPNRRPGRLGRFDRRRHRLQRTRGADAHRRVRSGLVALDSAVANDMSCLVDRAHFARAASACASGSAETMEDTAISRLSLPSRRCCSSGRLQQHQQERAGRRRRTAVAPGSGARLRQNVGDRVFFDFDKSIIGEDGRADPQR